MGSTRWLNPAHDECPLNVDILGLHAAMFDHVLDWAGRPRSSDVGAGGIVFVPWQSVRLELRELAGNLAAWVTAVGSDPNLEEVAFVIADCHHFPDESWEERYYDGLAEADNHRPAPLREYYLERIQATFESTSLQSEAPR